MTDPSLGPGVARSNMEKIHRGERQNREGNKDKEGELHFISLLM